MKLEDQVCSLELSKKLKELGVPQESYFHWNTKTNKIFTKNDGRPFIAEHTISAFTVAELGNFLGQSTSENLLKAYGHVFNVPTTRFITEAGLQRCLTNPNVVAKMLIYLIENGLVNLTPTTPS